MHNKQFFDPWPIRGRETTLLFRLFWWWVLFFSQPGSTLFNSNASVHTVKRANVKRTSSQLLRRPRPFRGNCFCSNRFLKSSNITRGSTGSNFKKLHGANSRFRPQPASQEKSLFWTKPSHQPVTELPALQGMSPEDPTHVFKPAACRTRGGFLSLPLQRGNTNIVTATGRPSIQSKRRITSTTVQVNGVGVMRHRLQLKMQKLISSCTQLNFWPARRPQVTPKDPAEARLQQLTNLLRSTIAVLTRQPKQGATHGCAGP